MRKHRKQTASHGRAHVSRFSVGSPTPGWLPSPGPCGVSPSLGELAVLVGPHLVIMSSLFRPFGDGSFDAAQSTLAGIERMHMIKNKQMLVEAGDERRTTAEQFYSL